MGRGKVGLRRTINILPLLSSSELNLATQCDALLRSLLGLSSSCFSCPPFISKPTSFSCSSFSGLVVDILDWLTAGSIITFPPLPPYQKQRSGRNDPRDRIIRHVTNGVGVITSPPLVSVTTLVIPMSCTTIIVVLPSGFVV